MRKYSLLKTCGFRNNRQFMKIVHVHTVYKCSLFWLFLCCLTQIQVNEHNLEAEPGQSL